MQQVHTNFTLSRGKYEARARYNAEMASWHCVLIYDREQVMPAFNNRSYATRAGAERAMRLVLAGV